MALNSITGMPALPITSAYRESIAPAPKGRVGPREYAPAEQEITSELTKATQRVGEADVEIEKAKREEKARELESKATGLQKFAQDVEQMPEKQALKELREQQRGMEFIPTKDTAQDIAGLFSLIGVIGMVVGKGNAQQAMGAMNGMLEGHRKGRADLFKQQASEFDKNFKAMQTKVSTALSEYQEALERKKTDKEAGELMAQAALARTESPLLKAMKDKQGDVAVVETLKQMFKSTTETIPNMVNNLQDKADVERRHREDMAARERMRLATLQAAQGRRDQKSLEAIGPALRNIAEQYPEGSADKLVGASPEDKKRIQGSYRAVEESEQVADFVAKNKGAVGALAAVKNFLKIDAINSIKNEDEAAAAAQKAQLVDSAIDQAAAQGKISTQDAQNAKVLQKKLFGLALADVQSSGQRGSVYLDRQFQNLYDQASRQDTLLKIIKERAEENNRNLRVYRLNVERHNNPEQFPLLESKDVGEFIKERAPAKQPTAEHIRILKENQDPQTIKFFDEAYGKGAADKILWGE
jgi:hypothetical protein